MHRVLAVAVALLAVTATACDRDDAHTASAPVGDLREATLELSGGADVITVRSEDLGDDLYAVTGSDTPDVERSDGVVRVRPDDAEAEPDDQDDDAERAAPPGRAFNDSNPNDRWAQRRSDEPDDDDAAADDADDDGPGTIEIRLNHRVRWTLRLAGGSRTTTVDMSAGGLAGVEFAAGTDHVRLALPEPEGTVAVRMLAGASEFDVTAPADVPARVRLGSGAGSVTVDGSTRTGVAAGTVLAPPSWDSATDRYDIEAAAGVSRLTVARD